MDRYELLLKEKPPYKNMPIVNNAKIEELINKMREENIDKRIDLQETKNMFKDALPKQLKKQLNRNSLALFD